MGYIYSFNRRTYEAVILEGDFLGMDRRQAIAELLKELAEERDLLTERLTNCIKAIDIAKEEHARE